MGREFARRWKPGGALPAGRIVETLQHPRTGEGEERDMVSATFHIRQSAEGGKTFFEVWRRSCDSYGECWESLLAEADTRVEAGELLRHYAGLERQQVSQ
jgi:hypothetical protein